jgi:hypothetical protein
MIPAVDRSSPRCWITKCCPIEATARIAKYGKVDRIAAEEIVLGAAMPPTTTKTAVATKAFVASGSSVKSLLGHGTRRTIVR